MGFINKINNFLDSGEIALEDRYTIRTICFNCKNKQEVSLEKGKGVKEELKKVICEKCNLKKLKMMQNQNKEDWLDDFWEDNSFDDEDEDEDDEDFLGNLDGEDFVEITFQTKKKNLDEVNKFIKKINSKKGKKNKTKK